MVDAALKYIGRKAGKHRISVAGEDDLLLVRADAKLIVQVIVNIVDNAIKYTAPDSDILITIKRDGDMAEIAVGDNGEGIPDGERKKFLKNFTAVQIKLRITGEVSAWDCISVRPLLRPMEARSA